MSELKLAAEFPPASHEDWLKLVEKTLKGASFEKKLVSRSYDGLAIQPLYPRAKNAVPVAGRAAGTPWTVMQRIDLPGALAANKEAIHELENGATGIALVCAGAPAANGYGLADISVEALS